MSRKPLVVAVDCDKVGCDTGIIVHGKGAEITVGWLEENLKKQGWTKHKSIDTGLEFDVCPDCSKEDQDGKDGGPS